MTGSMRDLALTEVLSKIVDNRGRTCPTAESGFPLIATNCIQDNHRYPVFEKVRYITQETRDNWFRGHPEPGDIVFVCKGAPGRVAVVPSPVPFAIAQDMVALRANPSIVDATYLYYVLASQSTKGKIANLHVGTMIPHFKKGDFPKLRLSILEDIDEQRRIAQVLGSLDDLIETNERIAASAAELRRSVVDSALQAETEHHPLSTIARFVNGKNFTKAADGLGRPIIRTPEVREGVRPSTVRSSVEATDDFIARAGDLLFVWSGSLSIGRWMEDEALVNQHVFKVIPNEMVPDWYVYACLEWKLPWFLGLAADKATTMGHIQRAHLDIPVPKLSGGELERLGDRVRPLWELELELSLENAQLRRTRDEMLPLLMSGAVRVRSEVAA